MKNLWGQLVTAAMLIRVWFGGGPSYKTRMVVIYAAGFLALAAGWVTGFVGPVVHQAGWVAWAVAALVLLHIWTAFRRSDDPYAPLGWLKKIDASILAVGFLGKLYAIASMATAAAAGGADAVQASGPTILHAFAGALFATMFGLGVSAWTHCSTLVYAHALGAAERDLL